MDWGTGWLLGIGLAIVLYLAVRFMERDYYKRKHEIIRHKRKKLEEQKNTQGQPEDEDRDRRG